MSREHDVNESKWKSVLKSQNEYVKIAGEWLKLVTEKHPLGSEKQWKTYDLCWQSGGKGFNV